MCDNKSSESSIFSRFIESRCQMLIEMLVTSFYFHGHMAHTIYNFLFIVLAPPHIVDASIVQSLLLYFMSIIKLIWSNFIAIKKLRNWEFTAFYNILDQQEIKKVKNIRLFRFFNVILYKFCKYYGNKLSYLI